MNSKCGGRLGAKLDGSGHSGKSNTIQKLLDQLDHNRLEIVNRSRARTIEISRQVQYQL